jgi:hypothetical protein
MCDNENVVTDEVKLINQLKKGSPEQGSEICKPKWFAIDKYIGNGDPG